MKILYIGVDDGTSKHRADALKRLGHDVTVINPFSFLPSYRLIHFWQWRTGGFILEDIVRREITLSLKKLNKIFDLIFVNHGELIGPKIFKVLKKFSPKVINYNVDDPFGSRDINKWYFYRKSIPLYDLIVVVRKPNIQEAYAHGAKKVIHVFRSADEVAHAPIELSYEDINKWSSDVLFVGTWMPERGPFMKDLISAGIAINIYGDRWEKAQEWSIIKTHWKGKSLYGDNYTKSIQSSKICLGLLSKDNRDLHTQRSAEIPYLGGLLCAERTNEHLEMYLEDEEAVFWSDSQECIQKCNVLLKDDNLIKRIKVKGRNRCIQNRTLNEQIMNHILASIFK